MNDIENFEIFFINGLSINITEYRLFRGIFVYYRGIYFIYRLFFVLQWPISEFRMSNIDFEQCREISTGNVEN